MNLLNLLQNKRHVIWDWNGTLFNDVELAVNTLNQLLVEQGLPRVTTAQYKAQFGFPVADFYKQLGFDFEKASIEQLGHRFVEVYMQSFKNFKLVTGIEEILTESQKNTEYQSILSAAEQTDLEQALAHFQIDHLFHHVFGIDNRFATSKLARGKELIEKVNLPTDETVLIGDTLHDLEVAQALGIEVILVSHGHQSAERLRKHHENVIDLDG